ncbi:hypothetical protein MHBO_000790 [Bonamia ostreae]|uniref:Uncharacterized protein n=1 Tax=Bonamia ostreae TaxID=126728 RepID=A0ABV2AGV1_9EUKA
MNRVIFLNSLHFDRNKQKYRDKPFNGKYRDIFDDTMTEITNFVQSELVSKKKKALRKRLLEERHDLYTARLQKSYDKRAKTDIEKKLLLQRITELEQRLLLMEGTASERLALLEKDELIKRLKSNIEQRSLVSGIDEEQKKLIGKEFRIALLRLELKKPFEEDRFGLVY